MAGHTDPDTLVLVLPETDQRIDLPAAARDQVAAWMDDPAGPSSLVVWLADRTLTLTRGSGTG